MYWRTIDSKSASARMKVAYTGRKPQKVDYEYIPDLKSLASAVDFLVVACPGGAATRNIVDANVLAALGKKGTLINIARGSIVDEPALAAALQAGTIKGAGLDVFADEPRIPDALMIAARAAIDVRDYDAAERVLASPEAQTQSLAVLRLMLSAEIALEHGQPQAALAVRLNTGYALLVAPPYRIELSLNLLLFLVVGGFLALYFSIRLVSRTMRMLCYAIHLAGMTYLGNVKGMGPWYYAGVAVASLLALWQYWLIRGRDRARCFRAFRGNHWYGLAIFAGVVIDYGVRFERWPWVPPL